MAVRAADVFDEGWRSGWEPDPDLTVSQCADAHRILSKKSAAEYGEWRTSRTPYLREVMDSLGHQDPVRRVVFMKGTQLGATEAGNNWLLYVVRYTPGPALMVLPTVETRDKVSKQRLTPLIDETPVLRERIAPRRSRDSGNTLDVKEFPGGVLILAGANSAASLRSMPIRFLFCDEIDEYPADVDDQGDPVWLAERRTQNFARRKIYLVSTPTVKGFSRIEREFLASDQRRYFVPCPHCGELDWIRWSRIRWVNDDPATARLLCLSCSELIDEVHKTWMFDEANGARWQPTAESRSGTRGYHLSTLYSPLGWMSWAEIVDQWLQAQGRPELLKVFINTILGETYEERGEGAEPDALLGRREQYAAEVPHGVGVLTAGVDVQGDRLEVMVWGFGVGEEMWLIAYTELPGDPEDDGLWDQLDDFLLQTFTHESGREVPIEAVCIDSQGGYADQVYKFCKARRGRRVFAIRGGGETGKPLVGPWSAKNRYRCRVYTLCVDSGKDIIYARLRAEEPGPGYVHLPSWADRRVVEGITAEKAVRQYRKGRGMVRVWLKVRERNEPLDCTNYALAALYILPEASYRKKLPELVRALSAPGDGPAPPEDPAAGDGPGTADEKLPRRRRSSWVPQTGGGWVGGWKR